MKSNFKLVLGLVATLTAPTLASAALTVTVNGSGGGATTFAKLSEAINYVNTNSSEPNVINVTVDSISDDGSAVISVPMTINGDADNNTTSVDILVGVAAIRTAADIGNANGRAYLEVSAPGDVVINDITAHPADQGNTTVVDGVAFYKPESGTGNYTMNNVKFSGSITASKVYAPVDAPGADHYYGPSVLRWYAYLNGHGVFSINDLGGEGTYNTTLNDCHAGVARSAVLYITNKSGTTTINGGVYGHAGTDSIRVNGATGVTIKGTAENRVRAVMGNRSSAGHNVHITDPSSEVTLIEYLDVTRGVAGVVATPTGNGISIEDGTVTMNYVRSSDVVTYPLHVANGTVTVTNSTFHQIEKASAVGTETETTPNPVLVAGGTVTFTDSIFSGNPLDDGTRGKIQITGGSVDFTNCAIPTDGDVDESLDIATPIDGTAASNVSPVSVSPAYVSVTHVVNDVDNIDFLRPSEPAYATASSTSGALTGGAGPAPSAVGEWQLY